MRPVQIFILILLVDFAGCHSGQQPEPAQYSVPAEVEPFVKLFRDEVSKRNVAVSTDNLIITFGAAQKEDVCGQCIVEAGKTPRITLNDDAFCWQQASQNERECLVFHELGHCLLQRGHKADKFQKGMYVSLMNPDNVGVYATCRYPIGDDDCDRRPRRDYYVDELFNANTPAPAWSH